MATTKKTTQKEEIAKLKRQLKKVLKAYSILEEYACELVDDVEENETITHCNKIVNGVEKALDN